MVSDATDVWQKSKKIIAAAAHDGRQRPLRECSSTRRTRSVRVETHRSQTRKTPYCTRLCVIAHDLCVELAHATSADCTE